MYPIGHNFMPNWATIAISPGTCAGWLPGERVHHWESAGGGRPRFGGSPILLWAAEPLRPSARFWKNSDG